MDIETRNRFRDRVVESIEHDLVGPAGGENEAVTGQIFNRYLSGMLFPANLSTANLDQTDEPEVEEADDETGGSDNSLSMAYEALPASMGVSFFVKSADRLAVYAEAGRYRSGRADQDSRNLQTDADISNDPETTITEETNDGSNKAEIWTREPLGSRESPSTV